MGTLIYSIRKLIYSAPLLFGVTFIAFVLMVYFGPDQTYTSIGKYATKTEIENARHVLGYDRPFIVRYGQYVKEVATFDFGRSNSSGEKVTEILRKTVPVTMKAILPGFFLSIIVAIGLAFLSAVYRGRLLDRFIVMFSAVGMSISYVIVLIGFQAIFCTSAGLDLFPVQGWSDETFSDYLRYITVPTLAEIFVQLGYSVRFARAIFVEEMEKDHIRTARAYGCSQFELMFKHVLRNSMIPIVTRIILSLPLVVISGSLLIESFFGIPGAGYVTFSAMMSGDLPVVKAVVACTSIMYIGALLLVDISYTLIDPRISLK